MKITNHNGLPEPLYQAIVQQNQAHSVGNADLSCTQLIDSPLIAWLKRTYRNDVTEDATDRLWALYGSIAHKILEGYHGDGHHVETEAIAAVDGMRVSGHIDLLIFPDGTLQDYKFTSAWTVLDAKKKGKVEWERQLNVYRYLLQHDQTQHFPNITKLQIVAMIRDYGPRHAAEGLEPIEILKVPLWAEATAQAYMEARVRLHRAAQVETLPPECTTDERWTNWKGENKRCDSYCTFGKQQLCPYRVEQ